MKPKQIFSLLSFNLKHTKTSVISNPKLNKAETIEITNHTEVTEISPAASSTLIPNNNTAL